MNTAIEQILANKSLALSLLGKNPQFVNPAGSYMVLKMIQAPETSAGGIYLTQQTQAKNQPYLAEVIKVGPGQRGMMDGKHIPVCVQEGDLVLVVKNTPYEVDLNGEKFWIGFEGDLLGRIDKEALAAAVKAEEERLCIEAAEKAKAEINEKGELVESDDTGEIRKKGSIYIATLMPGA